MHRELRCLILGQLPLRKLDYQVFSRGSRILDDWGCRKNCGCALVQSTPALLSDRLAPSLKLDSSSQLNLPLTEEGTISAGSTLVIARSGIRRQIEDQTLGRAGRAACGGEVVNSSAHGGNLRAVEEVEALGEQLQFDPLGQSKPTRDTHIQVPNIRLFEEVSRQLRETSGSS